MFQRNLISAASCARPKLTFLGGMASRRSYQPVLNSLGKNVVQAEYAVRGQIPIRGEEIMKIIK